jgi:sulfate permease, SulP family
MVGDVLAGITIGVMLIPQSMAYALLANMPPIMGLYTACIAPISYAFLGTSKHLQIGPTSLVRFPVFASIRCEEHLLNVGGL